MQVLIGSAKLMQEIMPRLVRGGSEPAFQGYANKNALQLSRYSVEELQGILHCNAAIARDNWFRYKRFLDPAIRRPAIFAYDGIVFKQIDPAGMTDDDLEYMQHHLLIGSFIYGLLRPMDKINPYRLEGDVTLPANGGQTMFDFWKPILTDWLIEKVKADDGVLVNLASAEFKRMFDWKRVSSELRVITPEFKIVEDGALKSVTVYAKMCRGAMTGWIMRNRITDPEQLKSFAFEGFTWGGGWLYRRD